jgi:hypothetical protein
VPFFAYANPKLQAQAHITNLGQVLDALEIEN